MSRVLVGDGAKRATLAAVGILLLLSSITALVSRELLWSGVFAVPAATALWIAIRGGSMAVKKAFGVVEHSAFTLHVPAKATTVRSREPAEDGTIRASGKGQV